MSSQGTSGLTVSTQGREDRYLALQVQDEFSISLAIHPQPIGTFFSYTFTLDFHTRKQVQGYAEKVHVTSHPPDMVFDKGVGRKAECHLKGYSHSHEGHRRRGT